MFHYAKLRAFSDLAFASSICVALCLGTAHAQHEHHQTSSAKQRKTVLQSGLGSHHHPVTTKNAAAQKFFDQGLTLVYAFNHEEAARSFQQAAQLDPQLAMAWWGYALAVGPNYNEPAIDPKRMKNAYEASHKARTLAAHTSDNEQALIAALLPRFTLDAKPDGQKLGEAYSRAMREVFQRFPDDLDAATLYADSLMNVQPWQLWSKDGKPLGNTEEIVAILEAVLKRDPQHIGANHLFIHAVEASRSPERALASAGRLGQLAPAAGHLVHMPGHIYLRTGDYAASAQVNVKAANVDRAYIKATGNRGMYTAMYFSHNLHFQVESYNRSGQFAKAAQAANELRSNAAQYFKAMPMVEGFLPSPLFVRMRFAKWPAIKRVPKPEPAQTMTTIIWHLAQGSAAARLGNVLNAEKHQKAFREISSDLPGETPFGLNSAASVLKIGEHSLSARIAWAKGDKALAIDEWRAAVAAEDALNYDEPPGWYYPVRESLGAALLLSGNATDAESVFREDLARNPRNGRSLFGLSESLKMQNKLQAAIRVKYEFALAWRQADTKLRITDL